jgi:hypothetical protein
MILCTMFRKKTPSFAYVFRNVNILPARLQSFITSKTKICREIPYFSINYTHQIRSAGSEKYIYVSTADHAVEDFFDHIIPTVCLATDTGTRQLSISQYRNFLGSDILIRFHTSIAPNWEGQPYIKMQQAVLLDLTWESIKYIIATKFYKRSATKIYNSREMTLISETW